MPIAEGEERKVGSMKTTCKYTSTAEPENNAAARPAVVSTALIAFAVTVSGIFAFLI